MNLDHAMDLLIEISTRDQRTIGETDAAAWANDLKDVTLQEGLDAATAFFRSETAQQRRIVAADIVQWVRWSRRQVVETEHRESLMANRAERVELYGREPQRALPPGGLSGLDPSGGVNESPALAALWADALLVPCTYARCNQPAGSRCVNHVHGESTTTKIPHNCRTKDSGHFSRA